MIRYLLNPLVLLHMAEQKSSAHFIPYFTKDKGNLHHLGPCTSLVHGDHWLFWALWKNIGKDWPRYYHLHPGHEENRFWVSSSDGFGQNSGVPTSHNGSEWMRHSACGSCWDQSSDSNSYVSPTSPGMLWRWDAWGEPVFHSWRAKSSSPVGFSTCKNWHKLCASCWEWLNILWHCTTETQSYLEFDVIPVCFKSQITRNSTGNSVYRYFICSWVRMAKWKLFLQKAAINKIFILFFNFYLKVKGST